MVAENTHSSYSPSREGDNLIPERFLREAWAQGVLLFQRVIVSGVGGDVLRGESAVLIRVNAGSRNARKATLIASAADMQENGPADSLWQWQQIPDQDRAAHHLMA
jgi:hypothetical protein